MRTYYRGRDAVVTSELFVRRDPSAKSFAIRDLRKTCIAADAGTDRSRLFFTSAGATSSVAAGVTAWATGSPLALALFVLIAPVTLVGTLLWQHRPASWELRAAYRGETVTLFRCCDATVFNQVARALRRAIEDDRRPSTISGDDVA